MDKKDIKCIQVYGISFISTGVLFLIQNMFLFFAQFPPDESVAFQK